jgi:hypothetical protein
MGISEFFQSIIMILMVTSFVALAVIFLQLLRGREDKAE